MLWHVDKYKITFKLVINSRIISRGPVQLMPGPGTGAAARRLRNTALDEPINATELILIRILLLSEGRAGSNLQNFQTTQCCFIFFRSSNPFTPCGAQGIHDELPGIAVFSYPLDLVSRSSCASYLILYCPSPRPLRPASPSISLTIQI